MWKNFSAPATTPNTAMMVVPNIVFVDGGICHPCLASHLRYGSLVLKGPNKSNHSKKSSKKGKHQRTNIPTTKINPQSIPTTPPS